MKLNLGCGSDYIKGFINIDLFESIKKDMKVDLNKIPYPFKDNTINHIKMINVLEHLKPTPCEVLNELNRICKNKALIEIEVPYANSMSEKAMIHLWTGFNLNDFKDVLSGNECELNGEIIEQQKKPSLFGKIIPKIPLPKTSRTERYRDLRDIASLVFNEIYTHLYIIIEVKKETEK